MGLLVPERVDWDGHVGPRQGGRASGLACYHLIQHVLPARGPFSLLLRLSVVCVLVSQPEPWGQTQTVCLACGRGIPVRTLTQPPCGRELSLRKCPESWRWWGWFLLPPFFMSPDQPSFIPAKMCGLGPGKETRRR